mgnify:CR=1 FL=1
MALSGVFFLKNILRMVSASKKKTKNANDKKVNITAEIDFFSIKIALKQTRFNTKFAVI